jgi:hypothetical protein
MVKPGHINLHGIQASGAYTVESVIPQGWMDLQENNNK